MQIVNSYMQNAGWKMKSKMKNEKCGMQNAKWKKAKRIEKNENFGLEKPNE